MMNCIRTNEEITTVSYHENGRWNLLKFHFDMSKWNPFSFYFILKSFIPFEKTKFLKIHSAIRNNEIQKFI